MLVAFVIPLGILRNGFRILVIGLLCVHVGPQMARQTKLKDIEHTVRPRSEAASGDRRGTVAVWTSSSPAPGPTAAT